jgi:hypothetical protein
MVTKVDKKDREKKRSALESRMLSNAYKFSLLTPTSAFQSGLHKKMLNSKPQALSPLARESYTIRGTNNQLS